MELGVDFLLTFLSSHLLANWWPRTRSLMLRPLQRISQAQSCLYVLLEHNPHRLSSHQEQDLAEVRDTKLPIIAPSLVMHFCQCFFLHCTRLTAGKRMAWHWNNVANDC